MRVADVLFRGAGGEPVDFARTIVSHGVAELPPNWLDLSGRVLETTLPVPGGDRRRPHVARTDGVRGRGEDDLNADTTVPKRLQGQMLTSRLVGTAVPGDTAPTPRG
jgi:hypothetical protein